MFSIVVDDENIPLTQAEFELILLALGQLCDLSPSYAGTAEGDAAGALFERLNQHSPR